LKLSQGLRALFRPVVGGYTVFVSLFALIAAGLCLAGYPQVGHGWNPFGFTPFPGRDPTEIPRVWLALMTLVLWPVGGCIQGIGIWLQLSIGLWIVSLFSRKPLAWLETIGGANKRIEPTGENTRGSS